MSALYTAEAVLNALPGQIALVDLDGTICTVNAAWQRLVSPDTLAGTGFVQGQSYLAACEAAVAACGYQTANGLRAVLAGETPDFTIEYQGHLAGELRWFSLMITPLRDERLGGAVVRHLDIDGARKTAEALRKSEERYRAFVAQSSEGIWRAELEPPIDIHAPEDEQIRLLFDSGVLAECNEVMAKLYGYSRPEEIVGARLSDLLLPGDPHNIQFLRRFIRSGYREIDAESHEVDKQGVAKYFLNSSVGAIENGLLMRVWGNQRDITERKQTEEAIRAREEHFRSLIENALDIITILEPDGTIRYESPSIERVLGYRPEELVGRSIYDLTHPDDVPGLLHTLTEESREHGGSTSTAEFRFRHKNRSWRILEAIGNNLSAHSYVRGIIINSRDVTDRKGAERAQKESEERFRALVQNVPGVVYLCLQEPRYSMLYLSAEVETLTGYRAEEFFTGIISFPGLIHPDDTTGVEREVNTALAERRQFLLVYRLRHKDGTWRWTEERGQGLFDAIGNPEFLQGTLVDITERKLAEEKLVHNALHDPLTDLPNRTLFLDRLKMAMERSKRRKEPLFAVQFIDLDRFKLINDSLGHMLGDDLLKAIAQRLKRCLRPGDTVARLGGDEFAVLLEDLESGSVSAALVAERIQNELSAPFMVGGQEVFSSASIGIALGSAAYEHPEELLRDADTAMYRAKTLGRACHAIFDPTMHQQALARLKLETALRRALDRQEFRLYYQPIVSLGSGHIVGFEALLRWQHPELGLLLPSSFLTAAENSGLILPIGQWVLYEACRQTRAWQQAYPRAQAVHVNVNLHALQFSQRSFVELIENVLRQTGLPPSSLYLELTEHVLMSEPEAAIEALRQLRSLGLGVCIDDFGIGYSSLSYLQRFPVTTLKIDRSFVATIQQHGQGIEIVQSIITLAHTMRLDVIAEGVETPHQMSSLQELGCELTQGFLFSAAVDGTAAGGLLAGPPHWQAQYFPGDGTGSADRSSEPLGAASPPRSGPSS
ncbi:MAG: EAL domain-containing protein [Acidobacteriota bacterium]|nr:EAL domain-containing protein [Acidobacteriota bacterium]